jgi:hypothetical protein
VELRLGELACLLPDLVGKMEKMKVDLLVTLLSDMPVGSIILMMYGNL